jgi:hypothetical protein
MQNPIVVVILIVVAVEVICFIIDKFNKNIKPTE